VARRNAKSPNTGLTCADCRQRDRHAFQVLPRRWVVERTFAWISKRRRTTRDYRMPILCSGEAAAVSKSSSSGHGSLGRVVRGAELATGGGPKALLDAAVAELRAREC
jgi:hypothetical protein